MNNIVDMIPCGHENAVTRAELARLTGESDRSIRDSINRSDELVINLQDGRGYFKPLPEEAHLVEEWIMIMRSRVREENRRIRLARRWGR